LARFGNVPEFALPKPAFAQFGFYFLPRARMACLEQITRDFAKCFLRFESVKQSGTFVPKLDAARLPPDQDRVERKVDEPGLPLQGPFGPFAFSDVDQHVRRTDEFAGSVPERGRIRDERYA